MRPSVRRELIVDLVRERERVTVETLARELDASPETIRRDLTELATRGVIRKFHGGAAATEAAVFGSKAEGEFQARMQDHLREKRAIARRAAALFSPGDALFVDTGTTTVVFAEELARLANLTVITNSVTIVQTIARGNPANRAFLIGGKYRDEASENLGSLAVEQIGRFRAPHVVLTAGAIEPQGVMDFDLSEAEIAIAMLAHARTLTVLADSSKFSKTGLFQVCPLSDVDRLVANRAPDGPLAEALPTNGVELIVAASLDPASAGA
jgi:DeoR family glycerol-3-phosphate regulon repressor